MVNKNNKIFQSLRLVIGISILGFSCYKLTQLVYIVKKLNNKKVGKPPLNADKFEEKLAKKCIKKYDDPISQIECLLKKVQLNIIIWLLHALAAIVIIILSLKRYKLF